MNMAGLSLDQAPPFGSVARFFVTAPIFGVIFGLFVAIGGADILDRFSPQTIGIVHLFTIGFVSMTIFGAMAQMLPVLAGVTIANFNSTGRLVYFCLSLGALLFFISFYFTMPLFKKVALVLLGVSILAYLMLIFYSITRVKIQNFTVRGVFIAVVFAIFGLLFGIHLLVSHAFENMSASHLSFANLHIVISIFGFAGLLIVAVAHQVLPMFFVAPSFPEFCKKSLYVFALLLVVFVALTLAKIDSEIFIKLSIAIFLSAFSTVALKKIAERRRKISDVSLKYWQIGLSSLLIGAIMLAISIFVQIPNSDFLFAVLFGIGFLCSIIKSMLNKIVPFLVWFHLSSEGNFDAPNARDLLPQKMARVEFLLNLLALGLLLASIFIPLLITIGGVVLSISFILLTYNINTAASMYARLSTKNDTAKQQ